MTAQFRPDSIQFQKTIDKNTRSTNGIYFTPKKVRDILFSELNNLNIPTPTKILEPSFGSGEFIFDLVTKYPSSTIVGIEKDHNLYNSVLSKATSNCALKRMDFLDYSSTHKFDLIIGNPPYFVLNNAPNKIKQTFGEACNSGRLNMCVLFLYKCLEHHLEDNGYIAFILTTSLYNSLYYQHMRDYIYTNMTIQHVSNLNKPGFCGTSQSTMLIILQKRTRHHNFIYKSLNDTVFISPYYKKLAELTQGCTTLHSLHIGAKVGNVVWNQVKANLTDDESQTLLVYPSNIKGSTFQLNDNSHPSKKQYVRMNGIKKKPINGPVILISRGYGNQSCFDSILMTHQDFYAENHIIVLYPKKDSAIAHLKAVCDSFQHTKTKQFINLFLGNGSLSVKHLEQVIPIFLS